MHKLGVNIDHVATLREARGVDFPDVVRAASVCEASGADSIVCHLRHDRRHIQDYDVFALRDSIKTKLNLEMSTLDEIVKIAVKVKPDEATLVPEKRRELTTEGGLDVLRYKDKIARAVDKLLNKGIFVSLFIDPEEKQVEEAAILMTNFIELHTGKYARSSYVKEHKLSVKRELEKIGNMAQKARLIGLRVNAGHGLDYNNVKEIADIPGMEELNIGFSIIARAVFVGMKQAVIEMRRLM